MELGLVTKGFNLSPAKKRWLFVLAAVGFSGYGAYRVYNSQCLTRKRKKLMKVVGALVSMAESVSDSAETIGIVPKDLKDFLNSDSDEMPRSLKQICKIARSEELTVCLQRFTESLTIGIYRGFEFERDNGVGSEKDSSFPERVMEKVLSKAGTGFVSVVVGSFARSLVLGFYSGEKCGEDSSLCDVGRWVDVVCSDGSKELIVNCIQVFVSTAVAAFLEKTNDVNVCDELFDGLTNPKHQDKVRELLVSVCNGAVETAVKTSHRVLTSSSLDTSSISRAVLVAGDDEASSKPPKDGSPMELIHDSGWLGKVSSTLAVPSNRKFVLDVTGRVTFETVRSFVELMLWTLIEGLKRSLNAVHGEIVDRGLQVVRFFCAKSSAIVTICLALHLYALGGTRVLLTA